ncbi:MAG: outer membrane lipoprotein-sorting protein [Gammaproteobacteria bacterium]|nr:outer membrane lipoprotein-sorting protein [Gammaproteobacteria bacterium]MBL6999157.1 outer membrane lipoprotein-sorting protein [Gammaproteobacteria bacterium]
MRWKAGLYVLVILGSTCTNSHALSQNLALPEAGKASSAMDVAHQVYFVDHFYAFENITMGYKSTRDMLLLSYSGDTLNEMSSERLITHQPHNPRLKTQDLVIFKTGKLSGSGILVDDFQRSQAMQIQMWLPALRKVRRFSEPDQEAVWGGSQLSYGDLYLRRPEHETHQFVSAHTNPACLEDIQHFTTWAAQYPHISFASWCTVDLQSAVFLKSTPIDPSPHYEYRIRMINPETFAEYQVEYFKNGNLVKRLQKNWHAVPAADKRAQIWNFWTVLVFEQGKLVAQSVALLEDASYQWNQSLPSDLWSEKSLRKIRR